jgi:DNA-binding NtrC family response regulator
VSGREQIDARRILYIDDDAGLGRLVERALSRHGFQVSHALNGDEGLERLTSDAFDVVALDHFMPGKEGLEVLAQIQTLADPPPVVYVTGADEGRIAAAALKAGAADYVIKDVSGAFLDLLRTAVEQAIDAKRLRREKEDAERRMKEARNGPRCCCGRSITGSPTAFSSLHRSWRCSSGRSDPTARPGMR